MRMCADFCINVCRDTCAKKDVKGMRLKTGRELCDGLIREEIVNCACRCADLKQGHQGGGKADASKSHQE